MSDPAEAPALRPLPSAAALALASAAVSVAGLAAALGLVGESAPIDQRLWAFLVPPVVAIGFSGAYLRLVYQFQPEGIALRKLFRGVATICLMTGFASGLFLVLWYRYLFPDVMQARWAEAERQMAEDGYSPGDIEEFLRRSRIVLYGPMGVVLGGIFWSLAALIPSSLVLLFSRR